MTLPMTVETTTSRERVSVRRSPGVRTVHGSPGLFLGLGAITALIGFAILIGVGPFAAIAGDLTPLIAATVIGAGAWFVWTALSGAATEGTRSGTPWRADGFTTPVLTDSIVSSHGRLAVQAVLSLVFAAALLGRPSTGGNARLMGYAFLGVGVATLLYMLWNQSRRWKFGRRKLVLRTIPVRPGETLQAIFRGGDRLCNTGVNVALQCIEQEHHVRTTQNSNSSIHSHRIYQEECSLDTDAQGDAPVSFAIPADLPGTRLRAGSSDNVIYWRLLVSADVRGLDYEGDFLLPVYGV